MQALSSVNTQVAPQRISRAAGSVHSAASEEAGSSDQVSVSGGEPPARPGKGKRMGWLGRTCAALALTGLLMGASGCAITTGGFDMYGGYQTHTTGVTPNGTLYQHDTRTTPWGTAGQTTVVGPGGVYYQQHNVPNYPVYPVYPQYQHHGCRPMTWADPGGCY